MNSEKKPSEISSSESSGSSEKPSGWVYRSNEIQERDRQRRADMAAAAAEQRRRAEQRQQRQQMTDEERREWIEDQRRQILEAEARRGIVRGPSEARQQLEGMRGDLDVTPMSEIFEQMPDMQPERSQSGQDRIFTYRFPDGSRLIFAARPRGGQTGLVLRYIDIQE